MNSEDWYTQDLIHNSYPGYKYKEVSNKETYLEEFSLSIFGLPSCAIHFSQSPPCHSTFISAEAGFPTTLPSEASKDFLTLLSNISEALHLVTRQ